MRTQKTVVSGVVTGLLILLLACLPVWADSTVEQADLLPENREEAGAGLEEASQGGDLPETVEELDPSQELEFQELPQGIEETYTVVYGDQEEWDLLQVAFDQANRPEGTLTFAVEEPEKETDLDVGEISDPEETDPVVEIDPETGVFTACRTGEATILVTEQQDQGRVAYRVQVIVEKGQQKLSGWKDVQLVYEPDLTLAWGDALVHTGDGALCYASSDAKVAQVDAQGNVTVLAAGQTTITVTAEETERYQQATLSATLTVEKGKQVLKGRSANYTIYFSQNQYDWSNITSSGDGAITFSSTNPKVVAVDPKTGIITQKGVGTATIVATAAETDRYQKGELRSNFTVYKGNPQFTGRETSYLVHYSGTRYDWSNLKSSGGGPLTFSSSNPKVATVDPKTGMITQTGVGKTVITVTVPETANCRAGRFTSTITIEKGAQRFTGRDTAYQVHIVPGRTYDWSNLKASGGGALTFSSSNPKVATVNAKTGLITQVSAGSTVITVTAPETSLYEKAVFRSTIQILKGTQRISGINARYCVPREQGRVYDWGRMLKVVTGDGKPTFASSNPQVATVDAKTGRITQQGYGKTQITITLPETARYQKLVFQSEIEIRKPQTISGFQAKYVVAYGPNKTYQWGKQAKASAGGTLTFSSSNPKVASIDKNGVLTIGNPGNAVISIRAGERGEYAPVTLQIPVQVTRANQTITGIKASYQVGYQPGARYYWKNWAKTSGDGKLSYRSSNPSVASISADGVLTQKGRGTATITVTAAATQRYNQASITSKVIFGKQDPQLSGISSSYSVDYVAGKTYNLGSWLKTPSNGGVTFSSSDPDVVSVDRNTGLVRLEGPGTAVITVTVAETAQYDKGTLRSEFTVHSVGSGVETYNFSESYRNGAYYRKLMNVSLGSSQRANILAVARSQVGYTEGNGTSQLSGTANGSGNYTEYGRWYYYHVDSSDVFYRGAWCSMFVSWCANEAGISTSTVPPKALVAYMKDAFEAKGRYYTWRESRCGSGSKTIQPGDLIFYSATPSSRYNHIGIVSSVAYNGSKVTINTVEGNVYDNCTTRRWTISTSSNGQVGASQYIRGFACPNYSS